MTMMRLDQRGLLNSRISLFNEPLANEMRWLLLNTEMGEACLSA